MQERLRDVWSIPGSRRSPGVGNGNSLENPMDRGAWQTTVHRVTKSQTRLSPWACTHRTKGGTFRELLGGSCGAVVFGRPCCAQFPWLGLAKSSWCQRAEEPAKCKSVQIGLQSSVEREWIWRNEWEISAHSIFLSCSIWLALHLPPTMRLKDSMKGWGSEIVPGVVIIFL